MSNSKYTQPNTRAALQVLCRIAKLSNFLAKQLTGTPRTLAYRIKAEVCSSLILHGAASVNGVWPGGIVALDIFGDPPMRLHIRRSHLTRQAQEALTDQANIAPVVTNLAERCDSKAFAAMRHFRTTSGERR